MELCKNKILVKNAPSKLSWLTRLPVFFQISYFVPKCTRDILTVHIADQSRWEFLGLDGVNKQEKITLHCVVFYLQRTNYCSISMSYQLKHQEDSPNCLAYGTQLAVCHFMYVTFLPVMLFWQKAYFDQNSYFNP